MTTQERGVEVQDNQRRYVDPQIYMDIVGKFDAPPTDCLWWNRKDDFLYPGRGLTQYFTPTRHSREQVAIAAEDLGIKDLHIIPGDSRSWLYLHTARVFDVHTHPDSHYVPREVVVMLEGYRLGEVDLTSEKRIFPDHKSPDERGIWRTYVLSATGETWTFENWSEWLGTRGYAARGYMGHEQSQYSLSEEQWRRVSEFAENPNAALEERIAQALKGVHPEVQLGLVSLLESFSKLAKDQAPMEYQGYRQDKYEFEARKLRDALQQIGRGEF